MLAVFQGGCTSHYGWNADPAGPTITVSYSIDCPQPTTFLAAVELDENGTRVAHVSNFVNDGHQWIDALGNPVTHDERSVTFPFAKPARVYVVKATFKTNAEAITPPNCSNDFDGGETCTYAQAVTVPFTSDVVRDAAVAVPWSWAGAAQFSDGRTCSLTASASGTPGGGLTAVGSNGCSGINTESIQVYGDRKELVPLGVTSSQPPQYPDYTATSEADVPVVVPGHTYTVVYVVNVDTENTFGSDHFASPPPGCVLMGASGNSGFHCEIAANVTV